MTDKELEKKLNDIIDRRPRYYKRIPKKVYARWCSFNIIHSWFHEITHDNNWYHLKSESRIEFEWFSLLKMLKSF